MKNKSEYAILASIIYIVLLPMLTRAECVNQGDPYWGVPYVIPGTLSSYVRTIVSQNYPGRGNCPQGQTQEEEIHQNQIGTSAIQYQWQPRIGQCPNDKCPDVQVSEKNTTVWENSGNPTRTITCIAISIAGI
jgi:hypothetical protein